MLEYFFNIINICWIILGPERTNIRASKYIKQKFQVSINHFRWIFVVGALQFSYNYLCPSFVDHFIFLIAGWINAPVAVFINMWYHWIQLCFSFCNTKTCFLASSKAPKKNISKAAKKSNFNYFFFQVNFWEPNLK